jgi:hypothetical protein
MMRCWGILLVLCWPLVATAKQCPNPDGRQVTLGDQGVIECQIVLPKGIVKPRGGHKVSVYSSTSKKVYEGVTDDNGEFTIGHLSPGHYRIVVDGFGSYNVAVDPKDEGPINQSSGFMLWLTDQNCIAGVLASSN